MARLLRAWFPARKGRAALPEAILFATTTQGTGLDMPKDSMVMLAVRQPCTCDDAAGCLHFQLERVWIYCPPNSFAGNLVFDTHFGEEEKAGFPNLAHACITKSQLKAVIRARNGLWQGAGEDTFKYGMIREMDTAEKFCRFVTDKRRDGLSPAQLVRILDRLLTSYR